MPVPFDTPKKGKIKGAIEYAKYQEENEGIPYSDNAVARALGCHRNTVVRIRLDDNPRTKPMDHGKKRLIQPEHCQKIIKMYDEYPEEAPDLPWAAQLANACDVEASEQTIRKAMWEYDGYGKFVAESKEYLSSKKCEMRVSECKQLLKELDQDDFLTIRYSDESHFGWKQRSMGRRYVSRRRGERYEPRNIREGPAPETGDEHKVHVWGAVGLGFKSELVRYRTANKNGKMSQTVYLNQILRTVVGRWLDEGDRDFILEEDNDSGHGRGPGDNIVKRWKDEVGLKYFFNPPYSPDLSPIENCWRKPNQYVYATAQFTETADELFERAKEGWEELSQDTIDEWVRSVRQRYEDVIENGGRMVGRTRPKKDNEDGDNIDQDQFER